MELKYNQRGAKHRELAGKVVNLALTDWLTGSQGPPVVWQQQDPGTVVLCTGTWCWWWDKVDQQRSYMTNATVSVLLNWGNLNFLEKFYSIQSKIYSHFVAFRGLWVWQKMGWALLVYSMIILILYVESLLELEPF